MSWHMPMKTASLSTHWICLNWPCMPRINTNFGISTTTLNTSIHSNSNKAIKYDYLNLYCILNISHQKIREGRKGGREGGGREEEMEL